MTKQLAITGPRPHKLDNDYAMTGIKSKTLFAVLYSIYHTEDATGIIVGMALGTDTIAALTALNMGLQLTCAIPFRGQERLWPKKSQDLYHDILKRAHRVVHIHDGPMPTKSWEISQHYDNRNKWMVDQLIPKRDKLVSVWDGSPGGTRNCTLYATSKQADIIRIDPADLIVKD